MYKFIEKNEYFKSKGNYLNLIRSMFENDTNKLANIDEISNHLEYIFSSPFGNNAFLVLQIENEELIAMVNFFEYNNCTNEWCLFSLFTNKKYRRMGNGKKIMQYALSKLKNYKCSRLISGIEKDNIPSIKLHEQIGFKYSNCDWNELADGFPDNHLGFIYAATEY